MRESIDDLLGGEGWRAFPRVDRFWRRGFILSEHQLSPDPPTVNSVCLRTRYEQKLNVDFPTGRRASLEKAFFPGAAPFVQASAAESGRVRDWSVSDLAMHFYSREFDPLNPSGCSGPR